MNKPGYRFAFNPEVSMKDVEDFLLLAVLAAEGLHGQARVRLDAAYGMDEAKRTCAIDASTPVGQDVAAIFTGFAGAALGQNAFRVERAAASPSRENPCASGGRTP